jgi:CRISPR-associated endonuclease/helicase Cas3
VSDARAPGLTADDFVDFIVACHGREPFPWQAALTAEALASGRWPELVDVPTGLGKTSMIDIAVFVAAATVGHTGAERLGRRRCFFVVDRRIVVDEAYDHAKRLSDRLAAAERDGDGGVLGRVAAGLRAYAPQARRPCARAENEDLLPVTRMRGGVSWSSAWLNRPDQPGIVLGTVDQVGSRLLFRGYGVSERRRPIDAALTGTDALLLVDEAHLAAALLTTTHAVQRRDRLGVPVPGCTVIQLSATANTSGGAQRRVFALDVEAHRADAEASRRLNAGKVLTVREATAKDCDKVLADEAQQQLERLRSSAGPRGPAAAVLVVCNTVDRARKVHDLLRGRILARRSPLDADCELLIGRTRPLDRPGLQEAIINRYGIARPAGRRAGILVATQTVEVGVNIDADALITESASWDALVQRLGRLNRLGRFPERFPDAGPAIAVVVHDGRADAPVYGAARDATWRQLHAAAADAPDGVDVSPLACRALNDERFADGRYRQTPTDVPVLLQPVLDAWVRTCPVPMLDPPVAPYLHGVDQGAAAVQVLWRDGLISADPLDDLFDDDGIEYAANRIDVIVTQCPPRTAEMVEVPFHAARRWIAGQTVEPVSDLDGVRDSDKDATASATPFRVLARRSDLRGHATDAGPDTPTRWQWIDDTQLRPGDQIVVPAQRGGLDEFGWAPASTATVRDVAEPATFLPGRGRRNGTLRLDAGVATRLGLADQAVEIANLTTEFLADINNTETENGTDNQTQTLGRRLARVLPDTPSHGSAWNAEAWQRLRAWALSPRTHIVVLADPAAPVGIEPVALGYVLTGPIPQPVDNDEPSRAQPDRDDEETAASSVGLGPVTLTTHHNAVRARCGQIAAALGLPEPLRLVLEDAGGWHDLGKVEPRFQVMLHGGDPYRAIVATEPLAKSGMDPDDRVAWRRATRLSKLPHGARHEAWSAALVRQYLQHNGSYPRDQDLLVHLIAAHHGYARPYARLVRDPAPQPVTTLIAGHKVTIQSDMTVDLDQPARFARLNTRYGRWGLALLEAVVRCADMTVSEEGS